MFCLGFYRIELNFIRYLDCFKRMFIAIFFYLLLNIIKNLDKLVKEGERKMNDERLTPKICYERLI